MREPGHRVTVPIVASRGPGRYIVVSRMRRSSTPRALKKKQAAMPLREHWRATAARDFPEHEEFISSDDEEYGIYNLFFQLRGEFADAIARDDVERARKILGFAGGCLRSQLASDGEDISVAAGVSLFEHIFEDTPQKRWRTIFSAMPHNVYLGCRHYVEQWVDSSTFSKLDRDAKEFYG